MKIKIDEKPKAAEPTYPCLMQSENSKVIVLFSRSGSGSVVAEGDCHRVGHYSDTWAMASFTPFNGSVTLSND